MQFCKHFILTSITIFWAFGYSPANADISDSSNDTNPIIANITTDKIYLQANKKQKAYIKIELNSPAIKTSERLPVNLGIVIDRSIFERENSNALIQKCFIDIISQLNNNDTISIITYSDKVNTILPAEKVNDQQKISDIIKAITPGNGSMLFAAISKAAFEVRKFNNSNNVSRILLISSSQITIGPDSPKTMNDLGESLLKENITVTAIGTGYSYNEQALAKLAIESGGHYYYAESRDELPGFIAEDISNALSISAQNININIKIPDKVRTIKPLVRNNLPDNKTINIFIKELYAEKPNSICLEVDLSPGKNTELAEIAQIKITYMNIRSNQINNIEHAAKVIFTDNEQIIKNNSNLDIMSYVSINMILDKYITILNLRENGSISKAVTTARQANSQMAEYVSLYKSNKLTKLAKELIEMPNILQKNSLYLNYGRKKIYSLIYSSDYNN